MGCQGLRRESRRREVRMAIKGQHDGNVLCQYPSCDIIIQFSKILLLVEIGQRIHRISLYDFLQLHEDLLQEGRPLPGPETGLLSNTQK